MLTLWSIFVESRHLRRIVGALVVFAAIHVLGTVGYLIIGPASTSVVDALYMTFITVATIGYGEVVDLTKDIPVNAAFFKDGPGYSAAG